MIQFNKEFGNPSQLPKKLLNHKDHKEHKDFIFVVFLPETRNP